MSGMYFREIRPLFKKTEEFSRITRLFTIIIIPEKLPDLANRDFFLKKLPAITCRNCTSVRTPYDW
jgi:hypothetical protein